MSNLAINSRKLDLLKRTNYLIEKTKKDYIKFEKERKLLLELSSNNNVNYDEWEKALISIEKLIDYNK